MWGHVRKNFYTHVPSLQRLMVNAAQRERGGKLDEPGLDPNAWLPCERMRRAARTHACMQRT